MPRERCSGAWLVSTPAARGPVNGRLWALVSVAMALSPRQTPGAVGAPGRSCSVVTYMELVQGMRNKRELGVLREAVRGWQAKVLQLDHEISARAAS